MEYKIKTFTNERTVLVDKVIDRDSLEAFKKDLGKIIADDMQTVTENYLALKAIDEATADYYLGHVKYPPITLDITSPGGLCLEGTSFYDVLRHYNDEGIHPIECVMSGCIASMATFIVLGCDVRKAHKSTSFCVHSIGDTEMGKIQKHRDNLEEMERISNMLHEIYYKHTKLTREKIEEIDKLQKDWWFDANEALNLGFATEII